MPVPQVTQEYILDACKYIDEHGVPDRNRSTRWLLFHDGKTYPPKYVVAVAWHLQTGEEIDTNKYDAVDARSYLKKLGFKIQGKEDEYTLTITATEVVSTDERFTMDNLYLGDGYQAVNVYFQAADGTTRERNYQKGERRNSNQTMPRLACQLFEEQLAALTTEDKESFPICQYSPGKEVFRGIYPSVEEFKQYKNTIEYLRYKCADGTAFVLYCWNIFSTIMFVQECLKRFGEPGDQMVLVYREKTGKEDDHDEEQRVAEQLPATLSPNLPAAVMKYAAMLRESKNIILRGAPGTGKTYLAKQIAAALASDGACSSFEELTPAQQRQVEFVQFHPSYDYADFVEGLRPTLNDDGTMAFELKGGVFKQFVNRAQQNYANSQKARATLVKENSVAAAIDDFFGEIRLGEDTFTTLNGTEFTITDVDDKRIRIETDTKTTREQRLKMAVLQQLLAADQEFTRVKDIGAFLRRRPDQVQEDSYYAALLKLIKPRIKNAPAPSLETETLKTYVFIIDEINRGEISKIFGELFYAIDPGYRGRAGAITTQYANLQDDPNAKFYIPENVYIIGTMNDIDRSVDTFDFAMRRRFRFVEIKAQDRLEMLDQLADASLAAEAATRMRRLNEAISAVPDLNENYHIGPAYFLKLQTLTFAQLWSDHLEPLLQEYIQGMYDEAGIMASFASAYNYQQPVEDSPNADSQD